MAVDSQYNEGHTSNPKPGRSDAKRELNHLLKFAVVGAFGAVVDFSVLNLLIFGFGWNTSSGMLAANVISTTAAIISNFFGNRFWTFPGARNHSGGIQLMQFVLVSIVGLVINSFIFYLANEYVYSQYFSTTIAVQLSKATAIGVVMFWNFGANRLWTFCDL